MSTARMTFGTVLSTVSASAQAITTTVNVATKAVGMLDTYVSDAAEKQALRSLVDMEQFEVRLQEEISMEDTERQLKIDEFIGQSNRHQELYQANFDRIGQLLASRKTK